MPNQISKKNKFNPARTIIISSIILAIAFAAFFTYRTLHEQKGAGYGEVYTVQVTPTVSPTEDDYHQVLSIYKNNYAFNVKKSYNNNYMTFVQADSDYLSLLQRYIYQINELNVVLPANTQTSNLITLSKTLNIYEVKRNPSLDLQESSAAQDLSQTDYSNKIKPLLPQKYNTVEFAGTFEHQNPNIKYNFLDKYFFETIEGYSIVNSGLYTSQNKNTNTYSIVAANTHNFSVLKKQEYKTKAELTQLINNKELRIYQKERIGNGYTSEEPTIEDDLGVAPDATTTIKKMEIEYFYIPEKSVLVPLLRVDTTAPSTKYGTTNITFWVWILE